jgi:outer membrane usher protein
MATLLPRRRAVPMAVAWATVLLLSAPASGQGQRALLDLSVNGVAEGQAFIVLEAGEAWIDLDALKGAGVAVVNGDRRMSDGRTLVRLGSLAPTVDFELDEVALALRLTVQPALLGGATIDLLRDRPPGVEYRRAPSGFVNYGASVTSTGSRTLSLETGVSAGGALATSTLFSDGLGKFRRGLTSITVDDRARMNRYTVGDTVASTGALGGAVQLAGATLSRDFTLDPYFVRYPTIGLSGSVMTPSRVEIYVNDQLVRVEQLRPGLYKLNRLPLPVGSADTRVVVRDAFGGEQSFASSYYISQGVLGRGLQQFSYSVGAERLRVFESSWAYGRPVLLGLHRVGLTDAVTIGGRVEAASGLASVGPMVTARLWRLGQVEAIAGWSRGLEGSGAATSFAYEYTSRAGSVSVAARHMSSAYTTLATAHDPLRARLDIAASATSRVTSRLTAGLSWQSMDYHLGAPAVRRGTATASVTVGRRANLFVSANRSRFNGAWTTGVFAGLALSLSPADSANLSIDRQGRDGRFSAEVQRALPVGTGVGYRVQSGAGSASGASNLDAEVKAQSSFGRFDVRQTLLDGQAATLVDASGGLVFIGGAIHATRPVQDGFALVRVPDVANVRTFLSNQMVGRTDHRGDLVVPNLLPYYGNRLSIADSDVPLDRDVPRTEMLLAPPYRGGAIALFPAPRPWRVAGRIVVLRGTEVVTPSNWRLGVAAPNGEIETALGNDGAFYLEGVAPGDYRAEVGTGEDACRFVLHVPTSGDPVIRAGVITCAAPADPIQGDRR